MIYQITHEMVTLPLTVSAAFAWFGMGFFLGVTMGAVAQIKNFITRAAFDN